MAGKPKPFWATGPGRHYPQFHEILRNYVKLITPRRQGFDRDASRFTLRMQGLQGPKQRVGIDQHARLD